MDENQEEVNKSVVKSVTINEKTSKFKKLFNHSFDH